MPNILTFDLEDWHFLVYRRIYGAAPGTGAAGRLARQLDAILSCLGRHRVRGTFFVLSTIAEQNPEFVRMLARAGHEIASHGSNHQRVDRLSPAQFREDVTRSKHCLEDLIGKQVLGYRAPEFSVKEETLWALELLAEMGFKYSSSIFPIHHRRYGINGFPRSPQVIRFHGRLALHELPLATLRLWRTNLPVAGGGYFRLWPLAMLRWSLQRAEKENIPFVSYFHPYEFDPEYLAVPPSSRASLWDCSQAKRLEILDNLGRRTVPRKLDALLSEFRFCSCQEYLSHARLNSGSSVL